jgi:hypothetical protein
MKGKKITGAREEVPVQYMYMYQHTQERFFLSISDPHSFYSDPEQDIDSNLNANPDLDPVRI